MPTGTSSQVRAVVADNYVHPAMRAGRTLFSVAVKDVMRDLEGTGFPARNYPQICSALRAGKFLREHGLELESIDGPPSGQSTTVVLHYRVRRASAGAPAKEAETPAAKAQRLAAQMHGLLSEEMQAYGGGESFLRWVRREEEDELPAGVMR